MTTLERRPSSSTPERRNLGKELQARWFMMWTFVRARLQARSSQEVLTPSNLQKFSQQIGLTPEENAQMFGQIMGQINVPQSLKDDSE